MMAKERLGFRKQAKCCEDRVKCAWSREEYRAVEEAMGMVKLDGDKRRPSEDLGDCLEIHLA